MVDRVEEEALDARDEILFERLYLLAVLLHLNIV